MEIEKIKSFAKINFHIGVLGKLQNKLHKIETLVYFSNLHDNIVIRKIKGNNHKIKFVGKFAKGIKSNNTISTVMKILDERKLLNNKKFYIKIKKNIPLESGMGGGSMNAASLLNFFYKKKLIKIKKKTLKIICDQIGSDVILGINYNPKIINYSGKISNLKKKLKIHIIIIKPNFGCNTSIIYKSLKNFSKPILKKNKSYSFEDLKNLKNDLEPIALKLKPNLNNLKNSLVSLANVNFTRMTGSGSTFIACFTRKKDALSGTKLLKKKYKKYWCILSKTI